jgi:hypothetical protein
VIGLVLPAFAVEIPETGEPTAMVTSDCTVERVGFVDLDGDSTQDLVLQHESTLSGFRSSDGGSWSYTFPEAPLAEQHAIFEVSATVHGAPVQVLWVYSEMVEYAVAPISGAVTESWREGDLGGNYVGDLDGDGYSDLADPDSYRLSSTGTWYDLPIDLSSNEGTRAVGDLDADGFAELMIVPREYNWVAADDCAQMRGPGQVHLGGPAGIGASPLWQLYALGLPNTGLGRVVAGIAGEDVLVVTIVAEGISCFDRGDFGPGSLGLIHDAGTAKASLVQVVPVPQLAVDGYMPDLVASVGNEIAVFETARVQWFTFDPDTRRLSVTPTKVWTPVPLLRTLSKQLTFGLSEGREVQALGWKSLRSSGETDVLIWGRTADELGPSREGTTVGGCTWWADDYSEDWAVPAPEPTDTGIQPAPDPVTPEPPPPAEGCGCAGAAPFGSGGLAGVFVLAAVGRRPRAARIARDRRPTEAIPFQPVTLERGPGWPGETVRLGRG